MNRKLADDVVDAMHSLPSRGRPGRAARHNLLFAAMLVCGAVAFPGCSRNTTRLSVEGNVTIDGAPLPDGKISFTPVAGTASPTAGATIRNGAFSVPRDKGLRPGSFRVEIRAVRDTGKTARDDLSGGEIAQKEQFIPKRYNETSELVAEIKAGERNRQEFALSEK